ncbi:MAG: amidohydrolase [Pseudomonadales bacterium]
MPRTTLIALSLSLALLAGCGDADSKTATPAADVLIVNARIHTEDPDRPTASAMAIRNGRLLAVGEAAELASLQGPATRVEDLDGRFVMPGLIDAHAHPAWGGVIARFYCLFPATAAPDAVKAVVEGCVQAAPADAAWIQGGLWTPTFFERFDIASPRRWLDAISGDKAIVLKDDSGHNAWVNSKALALLGIDETTVAPPGTIYQKLRDRDELDGLLLDAFAALVDQLPAWTEEDYVEGARYALRDAARHGITGWKDASASETELAAYQRLDTHDELSAHVVACVHDSSIRGNPTALVARLVGLRDRYAGRHLDTHCAKLFMDGVPTTARTAAMLAPYQPDVEGDPPTTGNLLIPTDELIATLSGLDAAGFTVKIHTAGDGSVHETLNALEAVRRTNGNSGLRHELAHAGFVDDTDIPRFAALGAVADLSPYLWFPSPIIESVRKALGERGLHYWPNRTLLDAGTPLLAGSDWPSVAEDMNPWIGLETLITRRAPNGDYPGVDSPEQALSVAEAVHIFTVDNARALGLGDSAGMLAPGRLADFVVLDRNILTVPPETISETRVLQTWFEGLRVYAAEAPAD